MFQSAFSIPTCSDSLNLSDFISIGGVLLIGKRSRIAEKNATVSIPVLRGIFFGLANTGCKSSAAED